MEQYKFISKYKYNSVFFRIFFSLLSLTLVVVVVFYFFSLYLTARTVRETTNQTNLNMLDKTREAVDTTLYYVDRQLEQVYLNPDVISAIVAPDLTRTERSFHVANYLSSTVSQYDVCDEINLYIPTDGSILSSNGNAGPATLFLDGDPGYGAVLDRCAAGGMEGHTFVYEESALYYIKEYPHTYGKSLGYLIVRLNRDTLGGALRSDQYSYMGGIWVFAPSGRAILSGSAAAPDADMQAVIPLFSDAVPIFTSGPNLYYGIRSPHNGWLYICAVDSRSLKTSYSGLWAILVPLLSIFAVVSTAITVYVTNRVYRPLKVLMQSVMLRSSDAVAQSDFRNEIDFLDSAYSRVISQNRKLSETFEQIVPDIHANLFRKLLQGRQLEPETVAATLESIRSPFRSDGRYSVGAIVFMNERGSNLLSEVELNLYVLSVENTIRDFVGDRYPYVTLLTDDAVLAVVLGFDSHTPVLQIKRRQAELGGYLLEKTRNNTFRILAEFSGVCHSIQDISLGYMDAKRQLSFHQYFGEATGAQPHSVADQEVYYRQYLKTRFDRVNALVGEGNPGAATQLTRRIVEEILAPEQDIHALQNRVTYCVDALIELLLKQYGGNLDDQLIQELAMEKELPHPPAPHLLKKQLQSACDTALRLMAEAGKRHSHRHIVAAKEYIDTHCADSALSLNVVAEQLQVSPSYLSKLFKDAQNISFVDYVNGRRIEHAKRLLDKTKITVTEIGFQTGFNSVHSFIRVFKKHMDMTPGQYRDRGSL